MVQKGSSRVPTAALATEIRDVENDATMVARFLVELGWSNQNGHMIDNQGV